MEGHAVAGRGRRPCMVSTNGKPWVEARGADGETQETLSPPPWAAGIKPGPSLIALVPEHMDLPRVVVPGKADTRDRATTVQTVAAERGRGQGVSLHAQPRTA